VSSVPFLIALGGEEVVGIIIAVVVGLISLFSQMAAKQREQKARQRPNVLPPQPGAPDPAPQQPAKLEDEIAEFLRRAAEGRAAKARPAQARPVAGPAAMGKPSPSSARPVQARSAPPRSAQARREEVPVAAEIVEPAIRPVGGRVEAAVAKDLDTSEFRERTKRLGKEARQVSQETKKRLHEKFDHGVSHLAAQPAPVTEPAAAPAVLVPLIPPTGAAGFAAMLRDVDNVRQAIILNEILTRPVDRW